MTTELVPDIDWVGYVDWSVRDFHSFDTFRGATYNAYLVRDEKTALVDAVKAPFVQYLLQNIAAKTDLAAVDYVVCNHAEPDHSGGLPELLEHLPHATLLCNAKCKDVLAGYYDTSRWTVRTVSPQDKISLGSRTLTFLDTPMVHWPESMFTYIPEEQLLFSMDAFGQHLATSERFDDLYDLPTILREAKSYYANIVTPYGHPVRKVLDAASALPIKMIAPSHGLIWRRHLAEIVQAYDNWSAGRLEPKVLILFDSMWDSTTRMAEAILQGATDVSDKVDVQLMHVRKTSMTRIAAELLDAAAVAWGTATLNMQMMPHLAGVLTYTKGLKFAPKSSLAFGSYGWAPAGLESLDRAIDELAWKKLREPVKAKYRPTPDDLRTCREAGEQLARAALEHAG